MKKIAGKWHPPLQRYVGILLYFTYSPDGGTQLMFFYVTDYCGSMENAIGDRFHVFHVLLVGQKIAISLQCHIPGDQGVEEILKNAHKRASTIHVTVVLTKSRHFMQENIEK